MRNKAFTIVAVAAVLAGALVVTAGAGQGCRSAGQACTAACAKAAASLKLDDLRKDEMKLVKYLADQIMDKNRVEFNVTQISKDTGLKPETIAGFDDERIQAAVLLELERRGFDTSTLAFSSGGGNCAEFGACSVDKNLMGASGDELARYNEEKATDGKSYIAWRAPDFTLRSTAGGDVSLSDYRGRPVALVLMATHCNHCVDTVPILKELRAKYESTDLVVLPVVVNGKSVKDVKKWAEATAADFPLLVARDKELSKRYETRLVPATFLINEKGYVTKKLVTFKDRDGLDVAFAELVGHDGPSSSSGSK